MAALANAKGDRAEGQGNIYPLQRTYQASIRLNFNHWLMTKLCGGLVHPCIPVRYERGAGEHDEGLYQVGEIASGTAIWALETAALSKSGNIHVSGFDISSAQYPPRDIWEECHVELLEHDCFQPFPQQWLAKFDLVNVRFMLCLVNDPDIDILLQRAISLLKPGGYIQWFEPLPLRVKTYRPPGVSEAETPATDQRTKLWHQHSPGAEYKWTEVLPEIFEKHGLNVEAAETIPLPSQYRLIWSQSGIMATEEFSSSSQGERASALADYINLWQQEQAKGVGFDMSFTWVIGRKKA